VLRRERAGVKPQHARPPSLGSQPRWSKAKGRPNDMRGGIEGKERHLVASAAHLFLDARQVTR
jgi:hypothetical protein